MKQPTEEQIKETAKQLRKPQGEGAVEIGKFMNEGNYPMNMHTLAVLDAMPQDSILELGMGNGYFVEKIVGNSSGISYAGYDYSPIMVQEASRINDRFIKQGNVSFIEGDIHQLPFQDSSFTKVFTINTFYFWEDAEKVLSEIKRVMKLEGEFVLSLRPKKLISTYPITKYGFHVWNDDEIEKLLKKFFAKIEITRINEPDHEWMGNVLKRECLIFKCM